MRKIPLITLTLFSPILILAFQSCTLEDAGRLEQGSLSGPALPAPNSPNSPNPSTPPSVPTTKACENNQKQVAFPGAEGFGRCAQGGRGGRVIEVTNLNDSGVGSLRDCMQQSGPRTCVFKVSGIINLNTCTVACTSSTNCPNQSNACSWGTIAVNHSNLTVAGQTAPGDGIMIRGLLELGGSLAKVSDVILRHIRVRPGYDLTNMSAIFVRSDNTIVDHVSVGWVTDEGIGVLGTSGVPAKDITIQWSIFSEGSHGLLVGGGSSNSATNVTVHHNYFALNWVRNPMLLSEGGRDEVVDSVNNLSYVFNDSATSAPCRGYYHHNYVGNAFIQHGGANYFGYALRILGANFDDSRCNYPLYNPMSAIYVKGNIDYYRNNNSMSETASVKFEDGPTTVSPTRFAAPSVTETDAFQAYKDVIAGAGARKPKLDSIDLRAVNMVKDVPFLPGNVARGSLGKIVYHENEVGGYPAYNSVAAPIDTDKDGMPDTWEIQKGLNPNSTMDGALDQNNDGYTNLEDYLNFLAK